MGMFTPAGHCAQLWKPLCFKRLATFLKRSAPQKFKEMVSIGDNWRDGEAAFLAAPDLGYTCHVKAVKFMEHPSEEDLRRQLIDLAHNYEFVMGQIGMLDLQLDVRGVLVPVQRSLL